MLLANKCHMVFHILPKLSYENKRELDKYLEEKSHSGSPFKSKMREEEKCSIIKPSTSRLNRIHLHPGGCSFGTCPQACCFLSANKRPRVTNPAS
jgi:hypothetical protein